MKKLRIILQHKSIYVLLLIISLFTILFTTKVIKYDSVHNLDDNLFLGKIIDIDYKDNYVNFIIKEKEKILCRYFYSDLNEVRSDFLIGNEVLLTGELTIPKNNTNPNQFNYKNYLYNKKIYRVLNVKKYELVKKNKNVFYSIKNSLNTNLSDDDEVNSYIKAFVIGKNEIDNDMKDTYRSMGISHLFAISGMHIVLIIGMFDKIIEKLLIKKGTKIILISLIVLLYMFITNFTASILRGGISFILNKVNKTCELQLSKFKLIVLIFSVLVLTNSFIIYDVGFLFSFILSSYLRIFSDLINMHKTYITKLFMISFICFVSSFPMVIYYYYEVNILSIFYNVITVPLVTFIVFPLSFLSFIFRPLRKILHFFISNLENLGVFSTKFNTTLVFGRVSIVFIVLYYAFITLFFVGLLNKKRIFVVPLIFMVFINYNYNYLFQSKYVLYTDVGQGDSILINNGADSILIDTGGEYYKKDSDYVIKTLKSLGIKKIGGFIITHGDFDHMGEAINLVNNFKVEKVIFNCGPYNNLEQELIKVLDKKNIKYYSCIKELNIDNNKLYFLQTKEYDNENDNSNVIYTEINGYKFMFMGDAGIEKEKDILDKYNISNVDILKVGHHGSKTSSSIEFTDEINPKYSIISVGKNNRYGHPNKEVLSILENSKIYRTDQDGSIMFKIKNNKLKIETCSP